MQKIYTVSTPCGSGKTFSTVENAVAEAFKGENTVIIMPTKALIDQTVEAIHARINNRPYNFDIEAIYGKDDPESVQKRLKKYLDNDPKNGAILLITETAFQMMPHFPHAGKWSLVKDEVIQVTNGVTHNMEKRVVLLKEVLDTEEFNPPSDYYRVVRKDSERLRDTIYKRNDGLNWMRTLAGLVLNVHTTVSCKKEQWDRLSEVEMSQIHFYSELAPTIFNGFKKVTIMGANLQNSLMYQMWSVGGGVEFIERDDYNLRFTGGHRLGNRDMDVYYLSTRTWSKTLMKQLTAEDWQTIKDVTLDKFAGEPFIYQVNNQIEGEVDRDIFNGVKTGCKLKGSINGMNTYQEYNNVYIGSALNTTPGHLHFLETKYEIVADTVADSMSRESHYQTAYRCSVRNPDGTHKVIIIMSDLATAQHFRSMFEDKDRIVVRPLPTKIAALTKGKPPKKPTKTRAEHKKDVRAQQAAYNQASAALQIALRSEGLITPDNIAFENTKFGWQVLDQMRYKNAFKNEGVPRHTHLIYRSQVTGVVPILPKLDKPFIYMTLFDSINRTGLFDSYPTGFFNDFEQVAKIMYEAHLQSLKTKEEQTLFSFSRFVQIPGSKMNWGKQNVQCVTGICLDDDYGTISQADILATFPNMRIIACNTFSSGKPCRFNETPLVKTRYIIAFDHPVPGEVAELIWDYLIETICKKHNKTQVEFVKDAKGELVLKRDADGKLITYRKNGKDVPIPKPNPDFCGFDKSKRPYSSIYYFPAQSNYGTQFNYFNDRAGEFFNITKFIETETKIKIEYVDREIPAEPSNQSPAQQKLLAALNEKDTTSVEHFKEVKIKGLIELIQKNDFSGMHNRTYQQCVGHFMGKGNGYYLQSQIDRVREAGLQVSPDDWKQFTKTMRAKGITGRMQEHSTFAVAA